MLEILNKHLLKIGILLAALVVLNFAVWQKLFLVPPAESLTVDFLNVGQGDSSLVMLPGGVKLLIDGGRPDKRVLEELTEVLPANDRYLDLVLATHNDADHLGGLVEILKRYEVGVFLYNGRDDNNLAHFAEAMTIAAEKNIPVVSLEQGDKIKNSESVGEVLWPIPSALTQKSTNEGSVVLKLLAGEVTALFAGDIGEKTEKLLAGILSPVDILKIPHHGSKYSSSVNFLNFLQPRLAVIEVGKNSYGHPTAEVLSRLAQIGASIYRTDLDGRVTIEVLGGKLQIFKEN
jgi:competence protein ComEC